MLFRSASAWAWDGGPLREEPPGHVQRRPDTWLARQGCEVYLGTREPTRDSRGPTSRRVAPGLGSLIAVCSCETVRYKCSTSSGPGPRASSAAAGMIGRDAVGQFQGVRDGEPVRAHESRCSVAPLLTCERIIRGKERELATPPTLFLKQILHTNHEGKRAGRYGCQPTIG